MGPLKQPSTLSEATFDFVKNWTVKRLDLICKGDVDGQLSQQAQNVISELRDHMETWLPAQIASAIITEVFLDMNASTALKFCTLQVFNFPGRTLKLQLGSMRESHYESLASYLKYNCSSVEHLNIRGVWLRDKCRDMFCDALRRMPHLKHLSVPYVANDFLVETLARKCAHLKTLDISGAGEVTDEGILLLKSLCGTLQLVNLGGPGGRAIDIKTVAKLINHLPKLVSLGGYPNTGQAIELCKEQGRSHPVKMKYIHDKGTTSKTLAATQTLCPDLCSMYLDGPQRDVIKYLHGFPRLRHIKVSKVNCDELHESLEKCGHRLTQLELVCARESLDLTTTAKLCPMLQSLEVYYSTSVHVSSDVDFTFPHLEKLIVYCTDVRGGGAAQAIIKSCPKIRKLTLCQCDGIDDDHFFGLLDANPMQECEELCLLQAPGLTVQTARCIITCLDRIRFIGRLDSWNMNWAEVEELRYEISQYNLDVRLWENFNSLERQDAIDVHDLQQEALQEGEEFVQ